MILLIDNYDSFTWNLYDYICQTGTECRVVRNNELSVSEISALRPAGIVISPGPGRPADSGITPALIAQLHQQVPMLGVCLGFQAIGEFFGAQLVHGPEPVHGKTATITCTPDAIFQHMPLTMEVMRYHSLVLEQLAGTPLQVIAQTPTGIAMALKHETLPIYGLQFHPESILTPHGLQMLKNWVGTLG